MSRIGKDYRNKLIAEWEKTGECSDPTFYIIKDKASKIQVRRKRPQKTDGEAPPIQSEDTKKGRAKRSKKVESESTEEESESVPKEKTL